jgi:hypothetical protein
MSDRFNWNQIGKFDNGFSRHTTDEIPDSVNDIQVGGNHYKGQAIQPWDFIISNGLGYLEGNIVKYVVRHPKKGGLEDLKKARHYLDKLIEVEHERLQKITTS